MDYTVEQSFKNYYNTFFPCELVYEWLTYNDSIPLSKREICFVTPNDSFFRYQFFESLPEFKSALVRVKAPPVQLNIGAIYNKSDKNSGASKRELVFDIDLTDYASVRTCCQGARICPKCWKFLAIACKVIDAILRRHFGFSKLLWIFSGRRGIHCWVCDRRARNLTKFARTGIVKFFQVLNGPLSKRFVELPTQISSSLRQALSIIEPYFETLVQEQDFFGTEERVYRLMEWLPEKLQNKVSRVVLHVQTSILRWKAFVDVIQRLKSYEPQEEDDEEEEEDDKEKEREKESQLLPPHLIEEIILYYAYPRIDSNVTASVDHLLRCPFSPHPETERIAAPFRAENVDTFNFDKISTIDSLYFERICYNGPVESSMKPLDITGMREAMDVFRQFLASLQ